MIQTLAPAAKSVPHRVLVFDKAVVTASGDIVIWAAAVVYVVVLVALAGQTLGMMVSDVRVVSANRGARVGFGRAIARYAAFVGSLLALVGVFSLFRRVQPYEKWSRTRLISGSAPVRS